MEIGIIIFAYNRSWHLQQTLEALKHNSGVNKIYIFQDGLKLEEHREEWQKTTEVICDIDWCEVVFHLSDKNKGLKKSILDGVNYVFQENDAVVVLEDDCVTTANFMTFMRQCLETYKCCGRVYSVSGYAWPIEFEEKKNDAYFCGRISSLGWGTWKDKWNSMEISYELTKDMKDDLYFSEQLALWGNDLEDMLLGNIKGYTDSWAVFWALSVIKHDGLCLNPYYSLVDNIGFDGTGVHSGSIERAKALTMDEQKKSFELPDELIIREDVKLGFLNLFGGVYYDKASEQKPTAVVYGMGNFFKQKENEINQLYHIAMFVDKNKKGNYAGRKIGKMQDILNAQYDVIILMLVNINEAIKVARKLNEKYKVPYGKIKFGKEIFDKQNSLIRGISENGKILIEAGEHLLQVESYDEYANAMEVFRDHIYEYKVNNSKKDIVFDIGGSIGDSTLWFLMNENVEKVYMYEPFPKTYSCAKGNLEKFLGTERLEMNQYGLSDQNEKREIRYNISMSCGQSTIAEVREKTKNAYRDMNLIDEKEEQIQSVEVRRTSEIFAPLVKKYSDKNLVLKIDCEGEEYAIFADLLEAGLLQKFRFIMLEWHYRGKEPLIEDLVKAGFSYWCTDKTTDMGLIYAFK